MTPFARLAPIVSAYALVSATLVVAQQGDPFRVASPQWVCEEDMHEYYVQRFVSSNGFGLSRMPQPPMLDRSGVLTLGGRRYSIERLELVGSVKSPTPIVYVPLRHSLPFRSQDFQSRALSKFEERALEVLRRGAEVERSAGGDGSLEVMGALRGDGSCLKCHKEAREGELLGAFSYTLKAKGAEAAPLLQPLSDLGGRFYFSSALRF